MKLKNVIPALGLIFCVMSVDSQEGPRISRCPTRCPFCPLRFAPCRFGEEFDFCGCCTTCLKGSGETCGLRRGVNFSSGKCADGLFCQASTNVQALPQQNVCRRNVAACFAPCSVVRCHPPPICSWGTGKDICGCCDICLQGPDKPCGQFRKCGRGLDCIWRGRRRRQGVCLPRFPEIL